MLCRIVAPLIAFSLHLIAGVAVPQEPEVTNVHVAGRPAGISENWLVVSVSEYEQGQDLNGDGELDDSVLHVYGLETGELTNLKLVGGTQNTLSGKWLARGISERFEGRDLNEDGDTEDSVLHVADLETGETRNLGVSGRIQGLGLNVVIFLVQEEVGDGEGVDLNGDGDLLDGVLHVHDLEKRETVNLMLAAGRSRLSENWVLFSVSEAHQGEDLNGDGDSSDVLLHVHDLEAGVTMNLGFMASEASLAGETVAFVVNNRLHLHNLGEGDTTDLEIVGFDISLSPKWLHFTGADGLRHVYYLETGDTLGLPARRGWVGECGLAFTVTENGRGDLNGDGDIFDEVLHAYNVDRGTTVNIELVPSDPCCGGLTVSGRWLVFLASEDEGSDLNGDGDSHDELIHVHDFCRGTTTTIRSNILGFEDAIDGIVFSVSANRLFYLIQEWREGMDLNGDGDIGDSVLHVQDLVSGSIVNLKMAVFNSVPAISERWLAVSVCERDQGMDLNGNGIMDDSVVHVVDLSTLPETLPPFLRGDCDADGTACSGVNDALTLLAWLFRGDARPPCVAACDSDGNGETELTDAVFGLDYCFSGTAPPPAPFPECGPGTEADAALGCTLPADGCQ